MAIFGCTCSFWLLLAEIRPLKVTKPLFGSIGGCLVGQIAHFGILAIFGLFLDPFLTKNANSAKLDRNLSGFRFEIQVPMIHINDTPHDGSGTSRLAMLRVLTCVACNCSFLL